MPKDKPPFIERHDAHVTAALDDRSEQHFRWMMEQDRPEHSENVEDWFNFYIERMNEIERVKHGPCEDETRRLNALRKLEASLKKHIATDPYTFNAQTVAKHQQAAKVPTLAKSRRDRALLLGKRLRNDNNDITIDELIEDPLVVGIWPSKERPKPSTLRRIFEGSGITKRGRRKADKNSESR